MKKYFKKEKNFVSINITSLIDVVFMLVIFFMLSSSFNKSSIPISLPSSENSIQSSDTESIRVTISKENIISSSPENSINPSNVANNNNSTENKAVKNSESTDARSNSSGSNSQLDNDNPVIQDIVKLIEENKIYPKNARLRNIEGDVKVAFCISEEGYLTGDITVIEATAPVILQKAAVESVSKAFRKPFKKLPQNLDLQITIRYSLIR